MLDFITKSIASLFGTASQREVKALLPLVVQINAEFDKLKSISDDELRASSLNLQKEIQDYLVDIDSQLAALTTSANDTIETAKKEAIFSQIDKLELERNVKLEEVLMIILPRAFAVVKETSRRYAQHGKLEVTATEFDREIARHKANVQVQGETATWHNKWLAAGNEITWEMVHYDVQLIGGIVLHQGKISEMATGEGKTLVATLPAFLNALAKKVFT